MSAITHVPFYPSDWLAGTRGMTAAEMGVYITLIAMMYERAGPIDGRDAAKLARLCGTSASALRGILDRLISDGKIIENDGLLFNRRVELEIKNVMSKSEVAREKANSRWQKKPTKSTNAKCNGIAPAMLTNNHKPIEVYTPLPPEGKTNETTSHALPTKQVICRAYEAAGSLPPDTHRVSIWLDRGYTPAEIEATVCGVLSRGKVPATLAYFDKALEQARAIPKAPGKPAVSTSDIQPDWEKLCRRWQEGSEWISYLGLPPDDPRTRVPPEIIAKLGITQIQPQRKTA